MLAVVVILIACLVVAYIVYNDIKCKNLRKEEEAMLEDPNTSEEVKKQIREKHDNLSRMLNSLDMKSDMQKENMIQDCKLENVYGTFKDDSSKITSLNIYDDYIAYEKYDSSGIPKTCFKITYDMITDAKCDTTENLTAMRFIALGVLAFAFKKKTYYTIITYKDDLTNSDQQLIFRVDNPINKDDFINNLLVKRNQYLIEHKKTV